MEAVRFGLKEFLLLLPIISLFIVSLVPFLIKVTRNNKEFSPTALFLLASLGFLMSLGFFIVFAGGTSGIFADMIAFDGLTLGFSCLVLVLMFFIAGLTVESVSLDKRQMSEIMFLLINSAIGALILISANDLLLVFIGLEMMSFPLYILIAMSKETTLAKEAAIKYFILGGLASAIFLFGVALLFGIAGTTSIPQLFERAPQLVLTERLLVVGFVMIIVGFCFKVSIFPFYFWTPDVYQGAPTVITTYMASVIKIASFAAFLRFMFNEAIVEYFKLADLIQWLAVLTLLAGNLAALIQNNFKRMLAYSSIAHSGFALIALVAASIGTDMGLGSTSLVFYLFSYSVMTVGIFGVVALLERSENDLVSIEDLKGLSSKHPLLSFCLMIFLLSLAGIPPTLGFFGKFYVFIAAIGEGLIWLAVWGVINSLIAVYYYLRPVVYMYLLEKEGEILINKGRLTRISVFVSTVVIIVFGLYSSPILKLFEGAIRGLF